MSTILKKAGLILTLSVGALINAQNIEPQEDHIKYKKEFVECWKINLRPKSNDVKKAFKKFIKDRYDVKMNGKGMLSNKDVLYAENVTIKTITPKRINFYASIIEDDELTEMKLFGNYGYSLYFNNKKQKEEFNSVRKVMVDFLKSYLPTYYKAQMTNATKTYDKYVKKEVSLKKDIADNEKKIEKLKKENIELSSKIEKNKQVITLNQKKLTHAQEEYNTIKYELESLPCPVTINN